MEWTLHLLLMRQVSPRLLIKAAGQLLASGINVGDPDYVDIFRWSRMTVTLTVDYGTLNVSLPAVTTVMVSNNTGSVILVGTLSDLNALIDTPTSPNGVYLDASLSPTNSIGLGVSPKTAETLLVSR